MKTMKRKMSTLLMAAMIGLTAVMPASAADIAHLEVYNRTGFATLSDMTWDMYGSTASVYVINEGLAATDAVVTYELYDLNSQLLAEGTLYSDYWVRYYDYREDQIFTGDFTTDSGGFKLRIDCSINGLACEGKATIEVN